MITSHSLWTIPLLASWFSENGDEVQISPLQNFHLNGLFKVGLAVKLQSMEVGRVFLLVVKKKVMFYQ